MELALPSLGMSAGWLRFERGDLAGQRYGFEVIVCPNPVCECGVVTLLCAVEASESPDEACVSLPIHLDLEQHAIDNFFELESDRESRVFAKAIASELTDADWTRLEWLYLQTKRRMTEQVDPDGLDVEFPPDALSGEQMMVGYREVLPYAKPLEFKMGSEVWLADDFHCVDPVCFCNDSVLLFIESAKTGASAVAPFEAGLSLHYSYDTGEIGTVCEPSDGRFSGRQLVTALKEAVPDLDDALIGRKALLRRLYRRVVGSQTPIRLTRKPGRNEPCPCGSGKKYKKCCGP